ncbi:MAG: hypothetical protein ACPKPY_08730 [Nitrososphaeraceae archaeon]
MNSNMDVLSTTLSTDLNSLLLDINGAYVELQKSNDMLALVNMTLLLQIYDFIDQYYGCNNYKEFVNRK